jgi:hypothetical protein
MWRLSVDSITIIIPVAPIPSHPSTEVLDETLTSIRARLPDSEIILMFDAVPSWLMHLKPNYEKYVQDMLWKINNEMTNVVPVVFQEHHHQSLMLKEALKLVRTPVVLWSEQDTPLTGEIPFKELSEVVLAGYANLIRFHHEAQIPESHQYLMLDQEPTTILGQPLIRTRQWSGRPHLASTVFYRNLVGRYWTDKPEFIEHRMYGIVVQGNYDEFRLHIYAPQGTLVRSLHLDGRRRGAEEFDPNPS